MKECIAFIDRIHFSDTFFGYIHFCGIFEPSGLLHPEVISPFASLFGNFRDNVVLSGVQSSHLCILFNLFARD